MSLSAAACSVRGTERAVNQDHVTLQALDDQAVLAVIADGLGGYAHSEAASSLAASLVCTHVEQSAHRTSARRDALKRAVQAANLALWQHALERDQPMRTTLTALMCTPDEAFLAHVGDCRIYVLRAGAARLLTRDHSWAGEAKRWRWLLPVAVPAHAGQARHALTRVLGDQPIVHVDTIRFAVQPSDRYILCSDGVWSSVPASRLAALAAEQMDDVALVSALTREAQARGSTDDASAVVVSPGAVGASERQVRLVPHADQPLDAMDDDDMCITVCRLV
jgi:serine/threonine protein phosphatase PrpC